MAEQMSIGGAGAGDEQYDQFEAAVSARLAAATGGPLFTTDASPEALWAAYLDGIPAGQRQVYNCGCCRRFVKRYGGLVTIDERGHTSPAVWAAEVPPFFRQSVHGLRTLVAGAEVDGVFLSSQPVWGTPLAGGRSHLHGTPARVYSRPATTAAQAMAEKREDFRTLSRGLADYPVHVVAQALRVLRADALDRSEKALGVAEFLAGLQAAIAANRAGKDNLVWRAVAAAPPGFCHVRSSMIATLLEDVAAGLPFDAIAKRWSDKMHPLRYQRPTAPPSLGTIVEAERLVEKLGVAASLTRRFARLDDVLAKEWEPSAGRPVVAPAGVRAGGVFDKLRQVAAGQSLRPVDLPAVDVTWERFRRTVLPTASALEVELPDRGAFYALVTAADPDAPAIIQWDGLPGLPRNPASTYVYHGGSTPADWGLPPGLAEVSAIFLGPPLWQLPAKFAHHGKVVHFALAGARDRRSWSLALFPEILKSEFHGIRSVIEAHSKGGAISGAEAGNANGLAFHKGSPVTVRVAGPDGAATYRIDRLD